MTTPAISAQGTLLKIDSRREPSSVLDHYRYFKPCRSDFFKGVDRRYRA